MIIRRTTVIDTTPFFKAAELITGLYGHGISTEDLLFFDIETTGLSADSSFLYLIGCLCLEKGELILSQFFSEGITEESLLISEFDRLHSLHPVLVHFNGSTFDVPYISKKRRLLGIPTAVNEDTGFDIYKVLHPYKAFLGAGSMSQKKLEIYCGLNRRDMYDGGELIEFYNRYIALKRLESLHRRSSGGYTPSGLSGLTTAGPVSSDELLELLFLHNYEDVLDMPVVARLLALPLFLCGGYSIDEHAPKDPKLTSPDAGIAKDNTLFTSESDRDGTRTFTITLTPESDLLAFSFNRRHMCECNPENEICAEYADGRCIIRIPVITEELKLFYPDHKNYYYLPAEDYAVHKSIGEFMNKDFRTRCTADKCYTRHTLDFIPLPGSVGKKDVFPFTVFKRFYNDKYVYVR
ncbi:MAG: ribonuclease H-like domain-containing protein, partial [Lachnospiraceae bacterium]|nr:ribonuclease H-like domain-containing protein [Lachnospiraceae bacterium]